MLVDPSFSVGDDRYQQAAGADDLPRAHAHYLGAALALWVTWAGAAAGILAAGSIPDGLRLEFVIPLFLAAELSGGHRPPPAGPG